MVLKVAGFITIVNVLCAVFNVILSRRNIKRLEVAQKYLDERRNSVLLAEYQKTQLCKNVCRYKNSNMDMEELEWQCSICPMSHL